MNLKYYVKNVERRIKVIYIINLCFFVIHAIKICAPYAKKSIIKVIKLLIMMKNIIYVRNIIDHIILIVILAKKINVFYANQSISFIMKFLIHK